MNETERLTDQGNTRGAGQSADAVKARAAKEVYLRGCRGPLPDGSCRMPEETCNHPTCPARG